MNPETGSLARCVKHPSQIFTGFCSTCLVERLSNVDLVESTKSSYYGVRHERADTSEAVPDSQRKCGGVRVRKTLLSLFELDDLMESENMGRSSASHTVCCGDSLHISQLGVNFEPESKDLNDEAEASECADASGSTCFDNKESEFLGDGSSKDNGISFWLHNKLPMKGLKWSRSTCKKGQMPERCLNDGIGGTHLENKPGHINSHYSVGSHDPSIFWEKSRHSWDGSMMSKALACSFSCLEEQHDSSGEVKRSLPDEDETSDLQRSYDVGKVNNGILADHNSLPPSGSFGDLLNELHSEESYQDITVSDVCRKKSNGWSRVLDWSITSPLWDFAKRNGHVLERSLSESWRDNHNANSAKIFHPDIELHRNGTALSNAHVSRSSNRDTVTANVNRQDHKADWQKKREFKISRSHSVRYSSPRNLDNGLLRFYLTPLRTSRRNKTKCRRTSPSLARGFLGL